MSQHYVRGVVLREDWQTDSSSFLDNLTPEMIDLIALTALFLFIIEKRESRNPFRKDTSMSASILLSLFLTPFIKLITLLAMHFLSIPYDWLIPSYCVCFWLGYAALSRPHKKQSQATTTAYHSSPPPRSTPYTPTKQTVSKKPCVKHAPADSRTQTTTLASAPAPQTIAKTPSPLPSASPRQMTTLASAPTAQTIAAKAHSAQDAPQQQRTYSTAPPVYRQQPSPPQSSFRSVKNSIIHSSCIAIYAVIAFFSFLLLVNNLDPSDGLVAIVFIVISVTIGAFISEVLTQYLSRH